MQKETWIGIAWAIGLFAVMGGVFAYEAATFSLTEYEVTWHEEAGQHTEQGVLLEGESILMEAVIPAGNLTSVEAVIVWTDSFAPMDTFDIRVDGLNLTGTARGATGQLIVEFDVWEQPNQTMIKGVSRDHAIETDLSPAQGEGDHTWTATISLVAAPPNVDRTDNPVGGDCLAGNSALPCDGEQAFRITWRWSNYWAEVA